MRKLKNCHAKESTIGPMILVAQQAIMVKDSHCVADLMILALATLSSSIKTLNKTT